MSSTKIKITIRPVDTKEEFFETVDTIAKLDITAQILESKLKRLHQEVDDRFGIKLDETKKEIARLMEAVQPYFVAHQEELCAKGQKQGETKLAVFGIRTGMPKFVKKVKTALKALAGDWFLTEALKPFVRTEFDINKDAIIELWKNDREKFAAVIPKSVTVTQEDAFWVEPKADDQVNS